MSKTPPNQTETAASTLEVLSIHHRKTKKIYQLLAAQLKLANRNTEAMGADIIKQVQGIEAKFSQVLGHTADTRIKESEMAEMISDIIATVQSQDITRQQVDFVCSALSCLSEDLEKIDAALADDGSLQDLTTTSPESLATQYCMDRQREIHREVLGESASGMEVNPPTPGDARPPKIQLF